MISAATAALAVSAAKGFIKLGARIDALLAEKAAVQAGLVLAMPDVYNGPSALQKIKQLKQYLAGTEGALADPLGPEDRRDLATELPKADPDVAFIGDCYRRVYPERLAAAAFSPDAAYVAELRRLLPTFNLDDPDTLAAAFQVTAGKDDRSVGYGARLGLLVADVVAEFGAENTARFVRDPGLRDTVQAVLERFARPELESFTAWSPLLRHALGATLNGVLDAPGALRDDPQWLGALLDVLRDARADPAGGDDFVLGLFQGSGYPLLLGKGLARAAEVLAEDEADAFRQLAADLLKEATPLAASSASFGAFFADHWGDLLRAGLQAMESHGPALLKDQPELLRDVLVGMIAELKEIPAANLLSSETLSRLGDAAIAAVAANPALLEAKVGGQPWLRALVVSCVNTMARDGLRLSFSREGLEDIVSDAAGVLAAHPELISDPENAGVVRDVVGGILRAVAELPSLDARNIATAAAGGTLRALADNPGLADTRYAALVAAFCGRLAELVQARSLTGMDATAIATAAVETLLENPALFDEAKSNLAIAVLDAVLHAAGKDPARLLHGRRVAETLHEVLAAVATAGKAKLQGVALAVATDRLAQVVTDALEPISDELGRRLALPGVPAVIGGLVAAWARGEFVAVKPGAADFDPVFSRVLAAANR